MVQVTKKNGLSIISQLPPGASPVLFLHGFPDTKEIWAPIFKRMGENALLALDLPSFGESDIVSDDEMKVEAIANRIISVLDELGISSFRIVSHDWGAIVAWEIYSRIGARIDSMTFANGPHPAVYHQLLRESSAQREIGKYAALFCSDDASRLLLHDNMRGLKRFHPFVTDSGPGSVSHFESKWRDPARLHSCLGIYRANFNDIVAGHTTRAIATVPVSIFWGQNDHSLVLPNVEYMRAFSQNTFTAEVVSKGDTGPFTSNLANFSNFYKALCVNKLFSFAICCLLSGFAHAQNLDPSSKRTCHSYFLVDREAQASISEIMLLSDASWLPLLEQTKGFGFSRSALWIRVLCDASKTTRDNQIVTFDYPLLNRVVHFNDIGEQLGVAGDVAPISGSAVLDRNPSFARLDGESCKIYSP